MPTLSAFKSKTAKMTVSCPLFFSLCIANFCRSHSCSSFWNSQPPRMHPLLLAAAAAAPVFGAPPLFLRLQVIQDEDELGNLGGGGEYGGGGLGGLRLGLVDFSLNSKVEDIAGSVSSGAFIAAGVYRGVRNLT